MSFDIGVGKVTPARVVTLGCNMKEQSGVKVLQERPKSRGLFNMPQQILPGRQSEHDERTVRYQEAHDSIKKPFEPVVLVGWAAALMTSYRHLDLPHADATLMAPGTA